MKLSQFNYDISQDVELLIRRCGVNIEVFRGKTVLITGGTGFFGVWMLSSLISIRRKLGSDLRLVVLSRAPEKFLQSHAIHDFGSEIEFVEGDVKNFRLERSIQATHLVHMAATNAGETFAGEEQANKLEMLYHGTRNVLERCGTSLEKVLFTSSGVAYGINGNARISESDHTAPDTTEIGSALGIGKLTAEYLVAYYAKKFGYKYATARCFTFAGPYLPLDLHYAFGNFIRNALEGRQIEICSDGQDVRSYLYIGDAMGWLLRLLAEPDNQIYNVGSSQPILIEQLAKKINSQARNPMGVSIQGMPNEVGNFRRSSYIPSTSKIIERYPGLTEWTSLEEIINKMLIKNLTGVPASG